MDLQAILGPSALEPGGEKAFLGIQAVEHRVKRRKSLRVERDPLATVARLTAGAIRVSTVTEPRVPYVERSVVAGNLPRESS